jgi:cytoskeletal protein CcmA (bactofilin family)
MWKRGETEEIGVRPAPPSPGGAASRGPSKQGGPATIGPSIHIKGDVSGSEDLVIQGRVEGTVSLGQNHVTVGSDGRVKANVDARTVTVEGEVEGDLNAQEQITLRRSARVEGNISAPRVSLEDGAAFKGGIDMQESASVGHDHKGALGKDGGPAIATSSARPNPDLPKGDKPKS